MVNRAKQHTIDILPGGVVRVIYDDALAPLHELGDVTIKRASHVEPTANGEWTADMSPVGGPTLGPFPLRGTALGAEVDWLEANTLAVA